MARFDVYRLKQGEIVVDCQSDIHRHLATRFVIPLAKYDQDYPVKSGLNPVLDFDGGKVVLMAEFSSTIVMSDIAGTIGSLDEAHDRIVRTLDFLMSGY